MGKWSRAAEGAGSVLILAALLLFGVVSGLTYFYADDFYYAIFFRGGLAEFWQRTAEHYRTMNGRALVHFIDEIVLMFGTKLFAVLSPFMLFSFFYCSAKTVLAAPERTRKIYFILAGLAITMLLPMRVARETLFWITGSMNYLLPVCLAALAFYLHNRTIAAGKIRWFTLLLCFLCGATTEQGGAAACVLSASLAISEMVKKRKECRRGICGWPLFFCILAGYATVLLAPGTFYRASYEGSFESGRLVQSFFALADSLMGKNGIAPYFIILFVLLAVLSLKERLLPKGLSGGFAVSCLLAVFNFGWVSFPYASAVLFCICLLFAAVAAIAFLGSNIYRGTGCFLLAALAAQVVLIEAPSTYLRTMLPSIMLLTVCIASLFVRLTGMFKKGGMPIFGLGMLIFVLGVFCMTQTIDGYRSNREVIIENEKSVMDYEKNGFAEISTDITYPYAYNMFYEDGFFLNYFYEYYNLPERPVLYYLSKSSPEIFYDGMRLTHPAEKNGGSWYLPLEPVVTAAGGHLNWNGSLLAIQLGEQEAVCRRDTLFLSDGKAIALDNRTLRRFGKIYWDAGLFSDVFGIKCRKAGENRIFVEMR